MESSSSSTEQSSSSDSEESVDSDPENTYDINFVKNNNFASCCDTRFYNPSTDESLDTWLDENSPSNVLDYHGCKWLSVIHPQLPQEDVDIYKNKWNRKSQTSQKIVDAVRPRRDTIDHEELLNMAVDNKILKGFWMIFCDIEKLNRYWSYLVKEFYKDGSTLQYSRIECSKTNTEPVRGVIFILNEKFTDQTTVLNLAEMCNKISHKRLLDLGDMYYKLAFYTDVGMYGSGSYILTSHAIFGLDYGRNVKRWFENHACQ